MDMPMQRIVPWLRRQLPALPEGLLDELVKGPKPPEQVNERNDASGKTVITERGLVRVDLPPDRDGSFELILIPNTNGDLPASMSASLRCTRAA